MVPNTPTPRNGDLSSEEGQSVREEVSEDIAGSGKGPANAAAGSKSKGRGRTVPAAGKQSNGQDAQTKSKAKAPPKKTKAETGDEEQNTLSVISAAPGVTNEESPTSMVPKKFKNAKLRATKPIIVSALSDSPSPDFPASPAGEYLSVPTNAALSGVEQNNIDLHPPPSVSQILKAPSETPTLQGDDGGSMNRYELLQDSSIQGERKQQRCSVSIPSSPVTPEGCDANKLSTTADGGLLDQKWNLLSPSAKARLLNIANGIDLVMEGLVKLCDVEARITNGVKDEPDEDLLLTSPVHNVPGSGAESTVAATATKTARLAEHVRLAQEAETHKYWGLKTTGTPRVRKSTQKYDPSL